MILAIETATPHCSVALVEGGVILAEAALSSGKQASETLLSAVSALFESREITPAALSCVAVSAGPGSFTGLRVGMASAKGFCFGWNLPVAPVSTLEALACRFPGEARFLCPVLDARKKEVYTALFRWEAGVLKRLSPDLAIPPETLPDRLPEEERIVLFGDGLRSYAAMLEDRLGDRALFVTGAEGLPSAGAVGILGERAFIAGAAVNPQAAVPAYIRPSEAEFKRLST
ncbi:MAG: tRNA (adenosine(37)-N6)-threonylcarbamoyltransferase complex dimerization subunit type 1 TsaB [Syntrophorhabdaceae bacterium]|nr:tRNA (adenosine(37)-N6)-threonylcarbamoyltransferase complex dimerization subunit type 1 TsaB [Syntrophorhabdaceae bacterium]